MIPRVKSVGYDDDDARGLLSNEARNRWIPGTGVETATTVETAHSRVKKKVIAAR
jgi:hypothetical protein